MRSRTKFHYFGFFVLSFASSALKHNCFSIFLVNDSPDELAVIYAFITYIPIIVTYNFRGVVSNSLTTLFGSRRRACADLREERCQKFMKIQKTPKRRRKVPKSMAVLRVGNYHANKCRRK